MLQILVFKILVFQKAWFQHVLVFLHPLLFSLLMFRYLDLDRYLDQLDMKRDKLLGQLS